MLKEYLLIVHLLKCFDTNFAKLSRILGEPLNIFGTHVRLALNERLSLGRPRKVGEKESLNRLLEEHVLSLLAVVVHAVTEDREVDVALLQKQIVLVVTMSVHKGYHAMDDA